MKVSECWELRSCKEFITPFLSIAILNQNPFCYFHLKSQNYSCEYCMSFISNETLKGYKDGTSAVVCDWLERRCRS
jgi:hypothetical protein